MLADPVVVCRQDDLAWRVRQNSDDHIGPGPHENGLVDLLRPAVPSRSTFVDAGAHVGHYALRMAKHDAQVIAIEPNPRACEALRANVHLNNLANIAVHDVAAHHRAESLRLWDPFNVLGGSCTRTLGLDEVSPRPAGYGISTMSFGPEGFGEYLDRVEGLPVDELVGSAERVSVIKIDVEGNEARVLAGAGRTIARQQPTVLIEMHHGMYGQDIWTKVTSQLHQFNYTWDVIRLPQKSTVTVSDVCEFIWAVPASGKNPAPAG